MNAELRKTKAALLAVSSAFAGVLLITFAGWFDGLALGEWNWLHVIPFGEFGGILFGAGVIGAFFEYGMRKEQAAVVVEQVDKGIDRSIPKIRDAVVAAFAIHPEDLRRVATPELLDDLAANAMSCASVMSSSLGKSTPTSATRRSKQRNAGTTSKFASGSLRP